MKIIFKKQTVDFNPVLLSILVAFLADIVLAIPGYSGFLHKIDLSF